MATDEQGSRHPEAEQRSLTTLDLLDSGLVGLWANREDIMDSLEYARQLRGQAQTRNHLL